MKGGVIPNCEAWHLAEFAKEEKMMISTIYATGGRPINSLAKGGMKKKIKRLCRTKKTKSQFGLIPKPLDPNKIGQLRRYIPA
jgi:hypothetical protein